MICIQQSVLWYGMLYTTSLAHAIRGGIVYIQGEVLLLMHTLAASILLAATVPVDVWSICGVDAMSVLHTLLSYLWCSTRRG
jgi:hypothetical protein